MCVLMAEAPPVPVPAPVATVAICRTDACWHRQHVKRQRRWIKKHYFRWARAHLPAGIRATLYRLRMCESTGNYRATNGQYTGAYQYAASTWARAGGHGEAMNASPAEQDVRTAHFFFSHRSEWQCKA